MRYPVTELGHTLSHRVLLPSSLELNQCVGKCDLIHGIDGDIQMTNQARMRLLRYVKPKPSRKIGTSKRHLL